MAESTIESLPSQVARIKPGDKVTATFRGSDRAGLLTITGAAYRYRDTGASLVIGGWTLAYSNGELGHHLVSIDSHEPSLPPEPPVGAVVVKDGHAYTRFHSHGRRCWGAFGIDEAAVDWAAVADGNVIFTPASVPESVARAHAVAARTPRFQ